MFAVPGWSVSGDALIAEKASSANNAPTKSRKRKRAGASENVTSSNVADLYESVVEGKKKPKLPSKNSKDSKRQKKQVTGGGQALEGAKQSEKQAVNTTETPFKLGSSQEDKKKNKNKKKGPGESEAPQLQAKAEKKKDDSSSQPIATATPAAQVPLPPAPAKLTPLQASMREKLISARFRHLNETLYTKPSAEAFQLFQESPEMFSEYHEGFRRQVKVWPENPVDSFLKDIRGRSKIKPPMRGKSGPSPSQLSKTALPRTAGSCTIADLGCGDAQLAESLQSDKAKLRVDVKSYDLQSPSPLVTKADIANLPLEDGTVNIAIFCLALMGTNWLDFVEEAYRILHWKGELWVAEIKSRFGPVRNKNAPVDHSVGNRRKPVKKGGKGAENNGPSHEENLAVEMDGAEDRRRETDVSAFVDALKVRGFVLQGETGESVDLSNKMFVKMHFMKGALPTKGKGVKPQGAPRGKKVYAPKWDADKVAEKESEEGNEAGILKPCVYKIR